MGKLASIMMGGSGIATLDLISCCGMHTNMVINQESAQMVK